VAKFVRVIFGMYAGPGQKELLTPLHPVIVADSPFPYEQLRALKEAHRYFDMRRPLSLDIPKGRNALKVPILNFDLPQSSRPIFPREVREGFPDKIIDFMLTAPEVRPKLQPIWQTLREAWVLATCALQNLQEHGCISVWQSKGLPVLS
jgi:hypothetical protein